MRVDDFWTESDSGLGTEPSAAQSIHESQGGSGDEFEGRRDLRVRAVALLGNQDALSRSARIARVARGGLLPT